jgi:hypothetical protein
MQVKTLFGQSAGNFLEVHRGVKPGDSVIVSDMSAYDSYPRINLLIPKQFTVGNDMSKYRKRRTAVGRRESGPLLVVDHPAAATLPRSSFRASVRVGDYSVKGVASESPTMPRSNHG